jgi:hypothetical protein
MSSYVITVNERVGLGKSLMNYLKSLSKTSDYVNVTAQRDSRLINEKLDDERYFSKADFECIENSKKSGICDDITQLEKLLRSKK